MDTATRRISGHHHCAAKLPLWCGRLGRGTGRHARLGKLVRIGPLPINTQTQAFWNAETLRHGADWTLRA